MWRNRKLEELAEALGWGTPGEERIEVPESAVRDLRGNRQQAEIAMKSGLSQQMVSDLERGNRHLTDEVAAKLAPSLGVTPAQLRMAEQVSTLKRAALKGALEPERLFNAVTVMADTLPDDEISDRLVDMLIEVLRKAIETYEAKEEATPVATKSQQRRDKQGRRIDDPLGLKQRQEGTSASLKSDEPTRDAHGRRINKPNDPGRR